MGLREDFEMPLGHELFLDHKVELSHRGVEETVRVEQHDWFIVQARIWGLKITEECERERGSAWR